MLSACEPFIYRAQPESSPEDESLTPALSLLGKVAAERPASPVAGLVNGEPVLVDYDAGEAGGCSSLLVTYQNLSYSETWEACPGRKISRMAAEAGGVPGNDEFKAVRHAVSQGAWKLGRAQAVYAGYEIYASVLGSPDEGHCVTVESVVSQHRRTIETSHDRVCGE